MQKKFAKDGVVVLSVHVGSLEEKDLKQQVAKKLNSKKASFHTVVLTEEEWGEKFQVITYPFVYVFNREGKWTKFRGEDARYNKPGQDMLKDIDRLVEALVAKK
jgi:hypothetical protein